MLKRITLIALLLALMVSPTWTEPQINKLVTFTTGTAIRVVNTRTMANSLFIQPLPGSTSVVYVLYADPGTTCVASSTTQIVAELAPGTATSPGQSFTYPSNNEATDRAGGFNVQRFCAQGVTGDTAIMSFDTRN